jgi:hypothetical protein
LVLLSCVLLPACGDEAEDETGTLEIRGEWLSDFESTEVISDDAWNVTGEMYSSSSEIVEFSNEDNSAVLLAEDGTYGRTVWSDLSGDRFHYCGVSFGKETIEAAIEASEPYDDSDPSTGCGASSFPWTVLTRK